MVMQKNKRRMPTHSALLCASLACLGSACTWVSEADLQAKQSSVDNDGDGFVAAVDCDDSDPQVNPEAQEAWYDGIDQDCALDDDYDADADGYVPDGYGGLPTAGAPGTGSLPSGDCSDLDADVHPGLTDTWYDGDDTNCDGADDFDADGDGYVPTEYAGLATTNVEASGALPGGDCDDDESQVNPGITDSPYDGIDANCSGNEDFDADDDDAVPDQYVGRATLYVAGSGSLDGGDCDDTDPLIGPGITEDYYNGTDDDCNPATVEFDQDGDGVPADEVSGGSPDCDDDNPDTFPGAVEFIGDAVDSDCDGGIDSFVLGSLADRSGLIEDIQWLGPSDVRFAGNNNTLWLSVAAAQVDITTSSDTETSYESVVAFGLPVAAPTEGFTRVVPWFRNPSPPTDTTLTPGHDLVATNGYLYGAFGLLRSGERQLRLGGWNLGLNSRIGGGATATTATAEFDDIQVGVSLTGDAWAVGCESTDGVMQVIAGEPGDLAKGQVTNAWELAQSTSLCELDFVSGTAGTVTYAESGSTHQFTFLPSTTSPTFNAGALFSALDPIDMSVARDTDDRWLAVADTDGSLYVADESGAVTVVGISQPVKVNLSATDASSAASPELVLGAADATGGAWIAWGDPTDGFTVVELNTPDGFIATEVGAWILDDDSSIVVAVVGEDTVLVGTAGR